MDDGDFDCGDHDSGCHDHDDGFFLGYLLGSSSSDSSSTRRRGREPGGWWLAFATLVITGFVVWVAYASSH
jgi:hypothetical protein